MKTRNIIINNDLEMITGKEVLTRKLTLEQYYKHTDLNKEFENYQLSRPANISEHKKELFGIYELMDNCRKKSTYFGHETMLINEHYFMDYALYTVSKSPYLPYGIPDFLVIDRQATIRNLTLFYYEIDFNGKLFYLKS